MGNLDRRNSMKMKRRKAQAKKKGRIKKRKAARQAAHEAVPAKKTRAAKPAAAS